MARRTGSCDKGKRVRVARPGVWKEFYKVKPQGTSDIKISNVPNRILAALEVDAERIGVSVQDIVRRQLEQNYPNPSDCTESHV